MTEEHAVKQNPVEDNHPPQVFHYLVTVKLELPDVPAPTPTGFSFTKDVTYRAQVFGSAYPSEEELIKRVTGLVSVRVVGATLTNICGPIPNTWATKHPIVVFENKDYKGAVNEFPVLKDNAESA